MRKKTTIVDIANYLSITPSAVSKAFSNHPRISDKTKKAVLDAAEKLGYQPNSLASALRKGRSGLIGVLVPGIHFSFFATIIKSIEETLSESGYSVIISQSRDDFELEVKQLESLMKAQVEGIIASIASGSKSFEHYKKVAQKTPLVLFDRTLKSLDVNKIVVDDYMGSIKAVNHLISKGYQRIAHIAGYDHVEPFRIRINGYKDALQKNNMQVRDEYILQCKLTIDDGISIMKKLLTLPTPPDAIFAASDLPAYGAIKVLNEKKIKIPTDFGVVGFSNEAFTSMVSPTITTIEQYSENMGTLAAKSLLDHLHRIYTQKEYI
ncbi:MAG: LacI family DNA-binding transcriptional regulator, partial [Bacteroidota bacterium]